MPVLKAFWKDDCPRCPHMKDVAQKLERDGYNVEYFDLNTVNGLAEGAYYSVMATPTLLLVDGEDNELAEWRGLIPTVADVKKEWETN